VYRQARLEYHEIQLCPHLSLAAKTFQPLTLRVGAGSPSYSPPLVLSASRCSWSPTVLDPGPVAGSPRTSTTSWQGILEPLSIQSGRGTWPVDSAATCREARCERHGDGRSTMATSRARAALDTWLAQAEDVLRTEEPEPDDGSDDDAVEQGDAA